MQYRKMKCPQCEYATYMEAKKDNKTAEKNQDKGDERNT
jgi:phage FluMu protein Com